MNDRYLFKAQRSSDGIWVIGCGVLERKHGTVLVWADGERRLFETYIDKSTLCQCTSLKDKEKNLIWENDIVTDGDFMGVIRFGGYEWGEISKNIGIYIDWKKVEYRQDLGYWLDKISVIGSIFDNPELLEVEHDGE